MEEAYNMPKILFLPLDERPCNYAFPAQMCEGGDVELCLPPRETLGCKKSPADTAALDEWMLRTVSTSHHISSTCKMGPASDPMAVVDQLGRVYGVEGLRVADASIMPDCIRANTNITSMVIGERIAELMRYGAKD